MKVGDRVIIVDGPHRSRELVSNSETTRRVLGRVVHIVEYGSHKPYQVRLDDGRLIFVAKAEMLPVH